LQSLPDHTYGPDADSDEGICVAERRQAAPVTRHDAGAREWCYLPHIVDADARQRLGKCARIRPFHDKREGLEIMNTPNPDAASRSAIAGMTDGVSFGDPRRGRPDKIADTILVKA